MYNNMTYLTGRVGVYIYMVTYLYIYMATLPEHGTWEDITAGQVSFPDANTTASKIVIRSPSPQTARRWASEPACPVDTSSILAIHP
jgi:hypothetical protein